MLFGILSHAQIVNTNTTNPNNDTVNLEGKTFMIKKVNCGATPAQINATPNFTMITIGKKIKVDVMNEKDAKNIGVTSIQKVDNSSIKSLKIIEERNQLNVQFILMEKGYTELLIYNGSGKIVYKDVLIDFQGFYERNVDIGLNSNTIYYLKIQQGKNYELKKIFIE